MRLKNLIKLLFIPFLAFICINIAQAVTYKLPPPGEDVVGRVQYTQAKHGETLAQLGRRYDIGNYEMSVANPGIHPNQRLYAGTKVLVPSMFILPNSPREGVVINLAELRLYYYPPDRNVVITEPVGIGKEGGWATPLGKTSVVAKAKNPTWRPTANVRREAMERYGKFLPRVVPPGPNNPLGDYAIRLGWPTYLIHGTNNPNGVGQRSSAGCIRMFPEDIAKLFPLVQVGTSVRVIHEPFKLGWKNNYLFLEAHKPLTEEAEQFKRNMIPMVDEIDKESKDRNVQIKWAKAQGILHRHAGIPYPIGQVA